MTDEGWDRLLGLGALLVRVVLLALIVLVVLVGEGVWI